jgi:hypothetical protein
VPEWDLTALAALHDCKQELEEREVLRWLRDTTRAMWRPNAERYEPSHLFDTPRGVAGLARENLRERMLAEYRTGLSPWWARGVRLTVPHGSLLIEAGDLAVHVIKAPGVQLQEPEWNRFDWDTSPTRHAAAVRNAGMDALPPPPVEGQLAFDFELPWSGICPAFRELFFVWTGDETGLTAGWLGLPRLGRPRWLAVTPLWRDDATRVGAGTDDVPQLPTGPAPRDVRGHRIPGHVPPPPSPTMPLPGCASPSPGAFGRGSRTCGPGRVAGARDGHVGPALIAAHRHRRGTRGPAMHPDPRPGEGDVERDDAQALSRATGGGATEEPDAESTTGTGNSEIFVGRVAGQDVGYAGETGAERRAAAQQDD